jgi:hypothetical protein
VHCCTKIINFTAAARISTKVDEGGHNLPVNPDDEFRQLRDELGKAQTNQDDNHADTTTRLDIIERKIDGLAVLLATSMGALDQRLTKLDRRSAGIFPDAPPSQSDD